MNAEDFEGFIDMEKEIELFGFYCYDNKLSGNIQDMKGFSELNFGRHPLIGDKKYGTTTS